MSNLSAFTLTHKLPVQKHNKIFFKETNHEYSNDSKRGIVIGPRKLSPNSLAYFQIQDFDWCKYPESFVSFKNLDLSA